MSSSSYYAAISRRTEPETRSGAPKPGISKRVDRPIPAYSLTRDGKKAPDELIKEWICEIIVSDGFSYGYKKLTVCLQENYGPVVDHKRVYRLYKELEILRPQRKVQDKHPPCLARRDTATGPNQLREMAMRHGYIQGTDEFSFRLSPTDAFDRCVIHYHLGKSCSAADAVGVLKTSLKARTPTPDGPFPKARTAMARSLWSRSSRRHATN